MSNSHIFYFVDAFSLCHALIFVFSLLYCTAVRFSREMLPQRWRIHSVFSWKSFFQAFPERQCGRSTQRFLSFLFPSIGRCDWQLPLRLEDSRPPEEHCGLSIRLKVTPCEWLDVLFTQLKGGVCVPCASDRGERIMGKQRASLPLSMLHCTSPPPLPPQNRWEKMARTPSFRHFGSGLVLISDHTMFLLLQLWLNSSFM